MTRIRIFMAGVIFMILKMTYPQAVIFTHQDSLRGSITPERAWWDLTYYHLQIKANPDDSTLSGTNTVFYRVLQPRKVMQLDLQEPMRITSVQQEGDALDYAREGNVYWIHLKHRQKPGQLSAVTVNFEGRPRVTEHPPWDAVMTWRYDSEGNPFFATSCQGEGASMWWPCKDHMYDEPDSMLMSFTVPGPLTAVGNGRLRKVSEDKEEGTRTFDWFVSNPINNYCVNMNAADYVSFGETFEGESGPLDCTYYVLKANLEKAKEHFKQVPMMLEAFEYWFGPYPFYEDGYKLVEVPYPGMEHQSSVTYGNGYQNGFVGRGDISHSGWGNRFDFMIIHESGHEWFANSITYSDIADMWVHEGFTAYSECLYVEYYFGKEAGSEYVRGTRRNIRNDRPIIGQYDVNYSGSGDMYPKGANMLHTLRQLFDDDEKWRQVLRGLNRQFYHQVVTSAQVEAYIDDQTDIDLKPIFDQYLRDTRIPVFEYIISNGNLIYRWDNVIDGFNMPVKVKLNGKVNWLKPTESWQTKNIPDAGDPIEIEVDRDLYIIPFNLYN